MIRVANDLCRQARRLEDRAASRQDRRALQADVSRAIRQHVQNAQPVPRRLRLISRHLEEDACEDMFDNMPV